MLMLLFCIEGLFSLNHSWYTTCPDWYLMWFSSVHINARIVPQLGCDHFLSNSFHFIIHLSFCRAVLCILWCWKQCKVNHKKFNVWMIYSFFLRLAGWDSGLYMVSLTYEYHMLQYGLIGRSVNALKMFSVNLLYIHSILWELFKWNPFGIVLGEGVESICNEDASYWHASQTSSWVTALTPASRPPWRLWYSAANVLFSMKQNSCNWLVTVINELYAECHSSQCNCSTVVKT